jgi:hypothetical protein
MTLVAPVTVKQIEKSFTNGVSSLPHSSKCLVDKWPLCEINSELF